MDVETFAPATTAALNGLLTLHDRLDPSAADRTLDTLDPGAFVGISFDTYLRGFSVYYWWGAGVSVSVITVGIEEDGSTWNQVQHRLHLLVEERQPVLQTLVGPAGTDGLVDRVDEIRRAVGAGRGAHRP